MALEQISESLILVSDIIKATKAQTLEQSDLLAKLEELSKNLHIVERAKKGQHNVLLRLAEIRGILSKCAHCMDARGQKTRLIEAGIKEERDNEKEMIARGLPINKFNATLLYDINVGNVFIGCDEHHKLASKANELVQFIQILI